jgi:hypothetical protein
MFLSAISICIPIYMLFLFSPGGSVMSASATASSYSNAAAYLPPSFTVDTSQPCTTIQIRLANGARLVICSWS